LPASCVDVVVPDLVPGEHIDLPGDALRVVVNGSFDLSALVVDAVGDRHLDLITRRTLDAPGVRLRAKRLTVTTSALRQGADRAVFVASPELPSRLVGSIPAITFVGPDGRAFARFMTAPFRTRLESLVAEIYRDGVRWRLRAVGRAHSDGLTQLMRDLGVDAPTEPPTPTKSPRLAGELLADVVTATNAERARHGLSPLSVDARLARVAQAHSADMVRRHYFAHANPEGQQVWDRAAVVGYAYRRIAENIAAGQRTPEEVMEGWMDSPGHRANILDAELTQIGVGRADGGPYGIYWTQVFATPR
jgi:uncharacterized protein YkwD